MSNINDIEALYVATRTLRQEIRRMEKLSIKSGNMTPQNNTPNQIEKVSADLNWQGMEVAKAEYVAHTAAVNAGIAEVRSRSYYSEVEFNPSAWHYYSYQPPLPKCLETD